MAGDGSVAPKERVNIVYKAATGDGVEEKELPLKMLMVGDYTGRADDTPVENRKPVNIDKNNFDDVLKAHDVRIDMNVENRLEEPAEGEEPGELSVSIGIESMKDFSPEQVALSVPETKALLQLREALSALKGPLGNIPAFRKKIQELVTDDDARAKLLDELGAGS